MTRSTIGDIEVAGEERDDTGSRSPPILVAAQRNGWDRGPDWRPWHPAIYPDPDVNVEDCANLTFGGPKRDRLFMAASQSLYMLELATQGAAPAVTELGTVLARACL
jgi:hypothetical protein